MDAYKDCCKEQMMSRLERGRLFSLRCRSKRGEYLMPEDLKFCEDMLKRFPEEYKRMDSEVFEATKPFGCI